MKTMNCALLAFCWASLWFLGCGTPDQSISVAATQTQGQSSSYMPRPCELCFGASIAHETECLAQFGMIPDQCDYASDGSSVATN